MPELPEIETTLRGIAPHLLGQRVQQIIVRDPRLRWPIPAELEPGLRGQVIETLRRRAKYLLIGTPKGSLIVHLGMSGSLRIVDAHTPAERHDHVDIVFSRNTVLRLRDPRRFGALLWQKGDPLTHPLLRYLGPEPLGEGFSGKYLYLKSRARRLTVKSFIMDSRIVAGIGNIYANEALFISGIHPHRAAGRVSLARYRNLASGIRQVLRQAITQGGTTLRDFVREDGSPGYFNQQLQVYGRTQKPCMRCGYTLSHSFQGQRSTYYCAHCQK
jgi:formamidopyrimidine-DNA glycosylase